MTFCFIRVPALLPSTVIILRELRELQELQERLQEREPRSLEREPRSECLIH